MINLSRKLYISIFTLIMMVILIGTTTFAWLKLNPNAFFDEMEISISSNEDLKISVDGVNYKNTLTSVDIKSAIVAKAYDYKLSLDTTNGGYNFIDNKTNEVISSANLDQLFRNTKFAPVTSQDGKKFYNLNGQQIFLSNKQYTQLDIYFESITDIPQDVYFSNKEIINPDGVIPKTEIVVDDKAAADENLWGLTLVSFDTFDLTSGDIKKYNSKHPEEKIEGFSMYASDAIRFAFTTTSVQGSDSVVTEHGMYEINKGRGSYATNMNENIYSVDPSKTHAGAASAAYDAKKNAAFTYYNNYKKYELEEGTGTDKTIDPINFSTMPRTYKGLDTLDAASILSLTKANGYGRNGTAKMTITFWLEGWDADCADMVLNQDVNIKLSFTNYNNVIENEPVDLTYVVTDPNNPSVVVDTWTVKQIVGMPISNDAPAYVDTNTTHKFLYWAKSDGINPTKAEWDFNEPVKPAADNTAARTWTLTSVWE